MQLQVGQLGLISRREVARIHGTDAIVREMYKANAVDTTPTTAATVTSVLASIVASLAELSESASASHQPKDLHEAGLGIMQLLQIGVQYIESLGNTPDAHAQDQHRQQLRDQQAVMLRTAYSNCCEGMWLQYLVSLAFLCDFYEL